MANIFEELMLKHQELSDTTLAESLKRKSVKTEAKKINFKKLRVESFKIFEEEDLDKLDQDFATDIDDEKADEDEVVLVIDPELPPEEEVPEDAAEQLVGDYVYKCPVCGANYVCGCDAAETEAIEVDEEGVPVECPVCGDDSEQILVGEIAPVEDVEKTEDEEEMEPVDNEDEKEDAEEEEVEETEEVVEEESFKRRPLVRRPMKTESKSVCPKCGKDPCVCEDKKVEGCDSEKKTESKKKVVKEDFDEDDTTFSDDIELVEPECPECEVEEEVEEEPKVEVNADKVEIVLDDMRFNKLMSKMIRENYKGSPQFKLTKIKSSKNTLTLEYVVRTGKKNIKGQFIAEGFDTKSRTMKLRMRDKGVFTESLTKVPAFIVECVRIRNKIVPTSVRYNFTKKVNESLYRVKGEVKSSK